MINNFRDNVNITDKANYVMNTIGPIGFYKYYENNKIELTDPCFTIPYTNKNNLSIVCKNKDLNIFTYTLWNEGTDWSIDKPNIENTTNIKTIIFLFIISILIVVLLKIK
jgi:hypothetical protein